MTKSPKLKPLTLVTWPHSVSDMTKAVFLSNLRKPAGVVSMGSPMRIGRAEHGRFGADMQVEIVNDGPVTLMLEA